MNQISSMENLKTSLISRIPSQFEAVALLPRGESFVDLDCLGLATTVVSEIANFDFQASIAPETWNFHGVSIGTSITGARRRVRDIQVRYVIWAIYTAIRELIRTGIWLSIIYQLKWQGEVVGSLGIYKTQMLSLPSRNDAFQNATRELFSSLPVLSNTSLAIPPIPVVSNFSTVAVPDPDLDITILRSDRPSPPLNLYGVYINILALLLRAAENDASQTISSPFGITVRESRVQAIVKGPDTTSKPMTRPPYLKWSFLCIGLKTASNFLVGTRYSREFKVRLLVKDVEIGNMQFEPRNEAIWETAEM